jgi:hypothetical protein
MSTFVDLDLIHEEPTDEQQETVRFAVIQGIAGKNVVLRLNAKLIPSAVIASVYYHLRAVCEILAVVNDEYLRWFQGKDYGETADWVARRKSSSPSFSFPVKLPVGRCGWVSQKTWHTVSSTHLASPCCLACSFSKAAT